MGSSSNTKITDHPVKLFSVMEELVSERGAVALYEARRGQARHEAATAGKGARSADDHAATWKARNWSGRRPEARDTAVFRSHYTRCQQFDHRKRRCPQAFARSGQVESVDVAFASAGHALGQQGLQQGLSTPGIGRHDGWRRADNRAPHQMPDRRP